MTTKTRPLRSDPLRLAVFWRRHTKAERIEKMLLRLSRHRVIRWPEALRLATRRAHQLSGMAAQTLDAWEHRRGHLRFVYDHGARRQLTKVRQRAGTFVVRKTRAVRVVPPGTARQLLRDGEVVARWTR